MILKEHDSLRARTTRQQQRTQPPPPPNYKKAQQSNPHAPFSSSCLPISTVYCSGLSTLGSSRDNVNKTDRRFISVNGSPPRTFLRMYGTNKATTLAHCGPSTTNVAISLSTLNSSLATPSALLLALISANVSCHLMPPRRL